MLLTISRRRQRHIRSLARHTRCNGNPIGQAELSTLRHGTESTRRDGKPGRHRSQVRQALCPILKVISWEIEPAPRVESAPEKRGPLLLGDCKYPATVVTLLPRDTKEHGATRPHTPALHKRIQKKEGSGESAAPFVANQRPDSEATPGLGLTGPNSDPSQVCKTARADYEESARHSTDY